MPDYLGSKTMGPQMHGIGSIYNWLQIMVKYLKLEQAPMPESGDNS
jgi:hypothetical protein